MKKRNIALVVALSQLLIAATVRADTSPSNPADIENWDLPVKWKLEAFKPEPTLLTTVVKAAWTEDQIDQSKDSPHYIQFPSFLFEASSGLQPMLMISDLPGIKFDRLSGSKDNSLAIQATVWGDMSWIPDREYSFQTYWKHAGDEKSLLELHSKQRFAQPGGAVYDLPNTGDRISGVSWEHSPLSSWKQSSSRYGKADAYQEHYQSEGAPANVKIKSDYAYIDSRQSLDQYRNEADSRMNLLSNDSYESFALTFEKGAGVESLVDMIEEYHLSVSQVYAVGTDMNDKSYTVSWFDTDMDLLSKSGFEKGFKSFAIIELEGKASGEDLHRLRNFPSVGIIDLEERGLKPTGIFDLFRRYNH